jgi:CHRD domain
MTRVLFAAALLLVGMLPAAASVSAEESQQSNFTAHLTGAQEVPPVVTDATGRATFEITDNDTKIHFRISSKGLDRITQAHIHVGARGTNGDVILFLFPLSKGVNGEGWSVSGTLTAVDLIPRPTATPAINTFADAVQAIRSGNTYANIHTVAHGGGEIRGQIGPSEDND